VIVVQRFGEKLRMLRKRHGMTIMELTTALGYIGYGYIHAIETSKKKPTAELVLKAAQIFGVTTDQLLRDDLEIDASGADTANIDDTP
jgi:transcriptional regulator with XRE-family HTH domain